MLYQNSIILDRPSAGNGFFDDYDVMIEQQKVSYTLNFAEQQILSNTHIPCENQEFTHFLQPNTANGCKNLTLITSQICKEYRIRLKIFLMIRTYLDDCTYQVSSPKCLTYLAWPICLKKTPQDLWEGWVIYPPFGCRDNHLPLI